MKIFIGLALLLTCFIVDATQLHDQTRRVENKAPKNIILMIGDGMGPSHIKAFRYYKDNLLTPEIEPLTIDAFLLGTLATDPLGSAETVTDSASSATAYATGQKAVNGAVSVSRLHKPLKTVLETAKQQGKRTGLISTSQIVHATPAAFIAHTSSRKNYHEIANAFVDNRWHNKPVIDLFLGGGWKYFKRDDRDLVAELEALDFSVVRSLDNWRSLSLPVAGLFTEVALPMAIDRPASIPSLATMVEVALDKLTNDQGFFLMVEGSQIDWTSHDNDIAGTLQEMDDFYQAVNRVLEFAQSRGDTLVLITADHETGGLSLGTKIGDVSYYQFNPMPVKKLTKSIESYAEYIIANQSFSGLISDLSIDPTHDQQFQMKQLLINGNKKELVTWIKSFINSLTYTGWTTEGHTGVDVNLYGYGPGVDVLRGHHDNTRVGQAINHWLQTKGDTP